MIQQTPAAKRVQVAEVATKVNGIKLKFKTSTNRHLLTSNCVVLGKSLQDALHITKGMALQDSNKAKANRDDIPTKKGSRGQPPSKPAKHFAPAVDSHCSRLDNLTAKNQRIFQPPFHLEQVLPAQTPRLRNWTKTTRWRQTRRIPILPRPIQNRNHEGPGNLRAASVKCLLLQHFHWQI